MRGSIQFKASSLQSEPVRRRVELVPLERIEEDDYMPFEIEEEHVLPSVPGAPGKTISRITRHSSKDNTSPILSSSPKEDVQKQVRTHSAHSTDYVVPNRTIRTLRDEEERRSSKYRQENIKSGRIASKQEITNSHSLPIGRAYSPPHSSLNDYSNDLPQATKYFPLPEISAKSFPSATSNSPMVNPKNKPSYKMAVRQANDTKYDVHNGTGTRRRLLPLKNHDSSDLDSAGKMKNSHFDEQEGNVSLGKDAGRAPAKGDLAHTGKDAVSSSHEHSNDRLLPISEPSDGKISREKKSNNRDQKSFVVNGLESRSKRQSHSNRRNQTSEIRVLDPRVGPFSTYQHEQFKRQENAKEEDRNETTNSIQSFPKVTLSTGLPTRPEQLLSVDSSDRSAGDALISPSTDANRSKSQSESSSVASTNGISTAIGPRARGIFKAPRENGWANENAPKLDRASLDNSQNREENSLAVSPPSFRKEHLHDVPKYQYQIRVRNSSLGKERTITIAKNKKDGMFEPPASLALASETAYRSTKPVAGDNHRFLLQNSNQERIVSNGGSHDATLVAKERKNVSSQMRLANNVHSNVHDPAVVDGEESRQRVTSNVQYDEPRVATNKVKEASTHAIHDVPAGPARSNSVVKAKHEFKLDDRAHNEKQERIWDTHNIAAVRPRPPAATQVNRVQQITERIDRKPHKSATGDDSHMLTVSSLDIDIIGEDESDSSTLEIDHDSYEQPDEGGYFADKQGRRNSRRYTMSNAETMALNKSYLWRYKVMF